MKKQNLGKIALIIFGVVFIVTFIVTFLLDDKDKVDIDKSDIQISFGGDDEENYEDDYFYYDTETEFEEEPVYYPETESTEITEIIDTEISEPLDTETNIEEQELPVVYSVNESNYINLILGCASNNMDKNYFVEGFSDIIVDESQYEVLEILIDTPNCSFGNNVVVLFVDTPEYTWKVTCNFELVDGKFSTIKTIYE